MRHWPILLAVLTAACAPNELHLSGVEISDQAEVVVLEGAALHAELTQSPARQAPAPFRRVGLMWEAGRTAGLEFSVSSDGETWSDWQPAQVFHAEAEEAVAAFVGALDVPDGATHYRVRAADGDLATFAVFDFLPEVPSPTAQEPSEETWADDGLGTSGQALSHGGTAVNPRSAWGARAPRCQSAMTPWRFTVHHTASPTVDSLSPEARLRSLQAYAMDTKGYCDIHYNFLVSRDGRLWQGRGATVQGGHTGGANGGNIGISIIGNHSTTPLTSTQASQISLLLKGLGAQFKIAVNGTTTKGHRHVGTTPTACPGDAAMAQLPGIIQQANATTAAPPPSAPPPNLCGLAGANKSFARGEGLTSCNGRYTLVHQHDGNVVLYDNHARKALWHTWTFGKATTALVMQGDGNLVLYNGGTALWHSGTFGHAQSALAVQDDGNLVIYAPGPKAIWSTGTHK